MSDIPAFPTMTPGTPYQGMTLRDYFAAKALAGLMYRAGWTDDHEIAALGSHSYKIADAMLRARAVVGTGKEP